MQTFNLQQKIIGVGVFVSVALLPAAVFAADVSELHITANGTFSAKNVVVMQKSGTSNLFTRVNWPKSFVRVTILSHDDTVVVKEHGEASTNSDIREGDTIDVDGTLSPGDGTLVINATHIVDHRLLQQSQSLSGIVIGADGGAGSFVLSNKAFGTTTIMVPGGVTIQKGARTIAVGDLQKGDSILSVSGIYDYSTQTLTANAVSVYQDPSIFVSRNFEGVLKSVSGTTLPATLTVAAASTTYTVYLPANAPVMKANRAATSLARYQMGDTVRFFGTIRKTNLNEIDAVLMRDTAF